jgi:hypothetical protein
VSCNGLSNGQIQLDLSVDDFVDYQLISNGITSDFNDFANPLLISDLESGIYTIEVASLTNICNLTSFNFVVGQPAPMNANTEVNDEINGMDGEITVDITGGSEPYVYCWGNGDSESVISGLSAGTYQLIVGDNNGCEIQTSILVESQLSINDYTTEFDLYYNALTLQVIIKGEIAEELFVYDSMGQIVQEFKGINLSNSVVNINPSLSHGMYFISNKSQTHKLKFVR